MSARANLRKRKCLNSSVSRKTNDAVLARLNDSILFGVNSSASGKQKRSARGTAGESVRRGATVSLQQATKQMILSHNTNTRRDANEEHKIKVSDN